MLVICNGAMKSGSTWLYNIALAFYDHADLPAHYQREDWAHPSMTEDKLASYLANGHAHQTHVIKAHYCDLRSLSREELLARATVLNISRDIRDAVTSQYFFYRKTKSVTIDIDTYYRTAGQAFVDALLRFHRYWDGVTCLSYERLILDFDGELARLADTIGRNAPPTVKIDTTLAALTDRYTLSTGKDMSWFFRKGTIGDWRNVLTPSIVADIEHRANSEGKQYANFHH